MPHPVWMTMRIELAWVMLETAAMAMFAASFTIQAKRIRLARTRRSTPRPLAPVICITRH